MEPRATRASKRRRLGQAQPSPKVSRSPSPDELASGTPTPPMVSRNGSTPSLGPQNEPSRPSYSPVSETSLDELDHTAEQHTFFRNDEPYRASVNGRSHLPSRMCDRQLRPPSPKTPEYSRISTPVASPLPERKLKDAKFPAYRCEHMLIGHRKGVAAVRISPHGASVATCSADSTIRIWDIQSGKCLEVLEGHLAGISTIAWSPDSETIASGSDDKSIRLWDIATGKAYPHPLLGHHHYIYTVAFSPKGNVLVSGSYDEAVILWDVRTRQKLKTLPAHSDPVGGVDFVRDGTLIVSCAGDGLIRIWDTSTGQCLRTLVHEDNAPVTAVRFSPNGKFVLAWTLDACVRLWNYVEGRCVKTYQGHSNCKYSLSGAFGTYGGEDDSTPRKAFVVSGSEDGRLLCWDVVSKEILADLGGHAGPVLGVDTREDGLIISCGVDRTVRIWGQGPDLEKAVNEDAAATDRLHRDNVGPTKADHSHNQSKEDDVSMK